MHTIAVLDYDVFWKRWNLELSHRFCQALLVGHNEVELIRASLIERFHCALPPGTVADLGLGGEDPHRNITVAPTLPIDSSSSWYGWFLEPEFVIPGVFNTSAIPYQGPQEVQERRFGSGSAGK